MLFFRSPAGVLSSSTFDIVVLRLAPTMTARRTSLKGFREGALDAAITAAFGLDAVQVAKARDANPWDTSRAERFAAAEIDEIVAGIRGGMGAMVGGSRCHTSYYCRDNQLFAEDFDEGATDEKPIDEVSLRYVVEGQWEAFVHVLRAPRFARFREALAAPTFTDARTKLADVHALGECFHRAELLEAVLAWPDERPDADAIARMTKDMDGLDLFHAVRSAIGYGEDSPEVGRFALRYFAVVEAMTGGAKAIAEFEHHRDGFRAMVPDGG